MSPEFEAGVRLFCLPNAGGGPALFRTWAKDLPAGIGVFPALLPGQGSRLREIPPTRINVLVNDLALALEPYLDEPYAIFGYSMGALTAFELVRELRRRAHPLPLALFVAARRSPRSPEMKPLLHPLPDAQFIQGIQQRYGGIPPTIMQDAEMMAVFTPVLRSNFTMIETYAYTDAPPFEIPVMAFGGTHDRTTSESQLAAWEEETRASFSYRIFQGDHFFIQQHQAAVLNMVAGHLKPFLA